MTVRSRASSVRSATESEFINTKAIYVGSIYPVVNLREIESAAALALKTYDPYEGISNELFFKVARQEISRRKTGFFYLERDRVASSTAEVADILRRSNDVGGLVPMRVSVLNQMLHVLGSPKNYGSLLREIPAFPVVPRVIQSKKLELIWNQSHQMLGVISWHGGYFGHKYRTYHSFAPRSSTIDDRVAQALAEIDAQLRVRFKFKTSEANAAP